MAAAAGKLDDAPLFASGSSLLGASTTEILGSSQAPAGVKLDDVPLASEVGMDYTALRTALAAGDFRAADDETRALLIRLAGPEAVRRNWVYYTDVQFISATDLQTMDGLWRAASGGKFGFSVQKELWVGAQRRWAKFFKAIGWVQGPNNIYLKWPKEFVYSRDAPKGHLPLTNALRGTQLFESIMTHPAFERAGAKKSIDASAAEAAAKGAGGF